MVECEECGGEIKVPQDVLVGEIIKCQECSTEYEVSAITPKGVELKAAESAEEDWGE